MQWNGSLGRDGVVHGQLQAETVLRKGLLLMSASSKFSSVLTTTTAAAAATTVKGTQEERCNEKQSTCLRC